MKYFKLTFERICLLGLLLCASGLRALLAWAHWPLLNSDEGTMGIMAIHIQHGERPIFFYGQNYMGALEAYIAAFFFEVLGSSIFTLRLGLILLFGLFLLCMYLLTTKKFALFIVLLLSLGSSAVLARQLSALGGYAETILFTVLLFLLTYQLICSSIGGWPAKRLALYACWGVVLGLALWCDALILPWAICSGMLLLLFCWREASKGLALLGGLLLGALPLISYNIGAAPGQDSWSVLIGQQGSVPLTLPTILQQVKGTLELSIPTISGNPFCHVDELADIKVLGFAPSQPATLQCHVLGGAWSLLYLALLLLSVSAPLRLIYKELVACHFRPWRLEERTEIARHALLCSLCAAALWTLLLYMRSHSPIDAPAEYARYLICLWVVTPLVVWPLWRGAQWLTNQPIHFVQLKAWLCRGLLLLLLAVLCYGSYETVSEIPLAQAADQQEVELITGLTQHHITHIYTDYWTCNRLAFQSQERIICGVLAGGCTLQRGFHNRYAPYYTTVSQDYYAVYVILSSTGCDMAVARMMQQEGQSYTLFTLNNYSVYQPF